MVFKTASIVFLFITKCFHLINKKRQLWKLFIVINREEKVCGKIISNLFTILIIAERENGVSNSDYFFSGNRSSLMKEERKKETEMIKPIWSV
jgi:hypothetical protein